MSTPLLENILAQASALEAVANYHLGPGVVAMEKCAQLLRKTRHVVISGMGASLFACTPLRYELAARGMAVSLVETAELMHFLDRILGSNTVLVLVSRSGESVEIIRLLDLLEGREVPTVGVTNVSGSTLASRADLCLLLNSPPDQLVAVQSYIGTVVTLQILAAVLLDEVELARSDLLQVLQRFSPWIEQNVAGDAELRSFVANVAPLYILGRGASLASVEEGVLLMHEIAKTPATGLSVAQFRHGFVEATDENIRAVVIGTQAATAKIDQQFAFDLERMGAAVRWIGPLDSSATLRNLGEWPAGTPDRFSGIFETVPLQMLAYRTAELRGIVPGSFRWASTVTGSESGFPGLDAKVGY